MGYGIRFLYMVSAVPITTMKISKYGAINFKVLMDSISPPTGHGVMMRLNEYVCSFIAMP